MKPAYTAKLHCASVFETAKGRIASFRPIRPAGETPALPAPASPAPASAGPALPREAARPAAQIQVPIGNTAVKAGQDYTLTLTPA